MALRQEIGRPQAEEFSPCGQKVHKSRMVEEAGFFPGRYEIKDHIFFILEVKETSPTTHVQKGSLEVQKGGSITSQ